MLDGDPASETFLSEIIGAAAFPMRHMSLYDTWPLMHGADERIDVRDLGFAAGFYYELPRRLLA